MKVTIEVQEGIESELIIRCSDVHAPQIQALQRLLEGGECRIPAQQQDERLFLSSNEILYGEFVGRSVFLYASEAVYSTPLSLKQLELDYNDFCRCSKSMVVNLSCIQRLRSEIGGRILVTLSNGEKILVSRHYASGLRRHLDYPTQKRGIV